MTKLLILVGAAAAFALAIPGAASAQSSYGYQGAPVRNVQCERQKSNDKAAGAIVGALAGGLIGGAIGNEIDDNQHDRNVGRYYRGGRGYGRGYSGHYRNQKDNDGGVIVGALLGAVVGGVAGSSIADKSGSDCQVATNGYNYDTYGQGGIPRTTEGLYGGPETVGRSTYPSTPAQTYPASSQYPAYPNTQTRTTYPVTQPPAQEECRTIYRETRLPDGNVVRDPVTACRQGRTGPWELVEAGDIGDDDAYYGY